MENSFALCIDKAREQMQGTGSAVLRWFNLQSITEVKSQLETMHLLFKAPRFVCSRDFGDLRLKSEVRLQETVEQIDNSEGQMDPFSSRSFVENIRADMIGSSLSEASLPNGCPRRVALCGRRC